MPVQLALKATGPPSSCHARDLGRNQRGLYLFRLWLRLCGMKVCLPRPGSRPRSKAPLVSRVRMLYSSLEPNLPKSPSIDGICVSPSAPFFPPHCVGDENHTWPGSSFHSLPRAAPEIYPLAPIVRAAHELHPLNLPLIYQQRLAGNRQHVSHIQQLWTLRAHICCRQQ